MKKNVLLIIFLGFVLGTNAQEKIIIKENFENNRLQWDEFYEKESTGSIQNGYYILENKQSDSYALSITELPVNIESNFKLTFKFLVPKVNENYYFGIVFDYEDENNYSNFLVSERKFRIWNKKEGKSSLLRKNSLILKAGKNKEVIIEMEKKGPKLIFSVDNMEAITFTKELHFSSFGFQVEGSNSIKISEVVIEQATEK